MSRRSRRDPILALLSFSGSLNEEIELLAGCAGTMGEEVQLDFENQMFIELLAEDGLVVLARYT